MQGLLCHWQRTRCGESGERGRGDPGLLPGHCWDAELAQGPTWAPLGAPSCPGPRSTQVFLPPHRVSAVMPPWCFHGVGRMREALAGSLTRLGARKTLGEVSGAMIHHVPVTRTGIFLSRE